MSRVVLLVDDDPLVLDVAASMLEDIGCEVVTTAGGAEALEKLSGDERIEVLITDINMPDIDGHALAKEATQKRNDLKVLVFSGRESDGCGFPLIRKPFLQEDLKEAMAQHTGLC
jgi:two-component system, cell cycle response regulator CpdR